MTGYACWFCDRAIERSDAGAVLINVRGFWSWHDGSTTDDDPAQDVYAHSACTRDRLRGAAMDLEAIFVDGDEA